MCQPKCKSFYQMKRKKPYSCFHNHFSLGSLKILDSVFLHFSCKKYLSVGNKITNPEQTQSFKIEIMEKEIFVQLSSLISYSFLKTVRHIALYSGCQGFTVFFRPEGFEPMLSNSKVALTPVLSISCCDFFMRKGLFALFHLLQYMLYSADLNVSKICFS